MNFSASPLSSQSSRDPMLASKVSPPRMYSIIRTGNSKNINRRLTGTLKTFPSVSSDMVNISLTSAVEDCLLGMKRTHVVKHTP